MVTAPSWRQLSSAAPRLRLAICLAIGWLAIGTGCNRAPREFRIDVNIDAAGLDKRELYVPANTRVAITLRNRDTSPAATARTFYLVQPGTIPEGLASPKPADVFAQGPAIAAGKSATFRFAAPTSGNYEFFCTSVGGASPPGGNSPTVLRGKFVVQ